MVYLVGAGPGEPKLSTLWAKELIERCDVLVFDNLANPELENGRRSNVFKLMWVNLLVGTLLNKEISKKFWLDMPPLEAWWFDLRGRPLCVWKMCRRNASFR